MQVLKESVRENILSAALEEFYDKGFLRASMRDISKRARVAPSNMYNYFENKERLFSAIAEPATGRTTDIMSDALNQSEASGGEFLEYADKLAARLRQLSEQERKSIIILMEQSEGTAFENTRGQFAGLLERHFAEELGADAGAYALRLIAFNFISSILDIIKQNKDRKWLQENLRLYIKYHLSGILALKQSGNTGTN